MKTLILWIKKLLRFFGFFKAVNLPATIETPKTVTKHIVIEPSASGSMVNSTPRSRFHKTICNNRKPTKGRITQVVEFLDHDDNHTSHVIRHYN